MMHFSGSKTANCLQQRLARNPVHSPPALRALDLQVCPHTTLLPHKKTGAHLREHRSDLHVMWSSQLARSHLHVMWSSQQRCYLHLREALDAVLGDARKE